MRIAVAGATGTVGRHVVESAKQAGHDVVALSRSHGVDVLSGKGLADALAGVETIIDVTNPDTIDEAAASAFFTETARNFQRIGAERGVRHIVTLSIIGIERTAFGYYAAKLAQERAAAGPVSSTILRATQFHELPGQLIALTRKDSEARVLDLHSQPVAARTVADVLIEIAEGAPQGRAKDLAGPEEADLVELGRRLVAYRGLPITVRAQPVPNVSRRALLPDEGARIEGPTFEEWLASEDAAALPL